MKWKIRKDLSEYIFTTDSGKLIDNNAVYETRWLNDDDIFQVNVDGEWCEMDSIDWEYDIPKSVKIYTIGDLKEAIKDFDDNDIVVVEIHEGPRHDDLYDFSIDVIDNIELTDGSKVKEIRLCI